MFSEEVSDMKTEKGLLVHKSTVVCHWLKDFKDNFLGLCFPSTFSALLCKKALNSDVHFHSDCLVSVET